MQSAFIMIETPKGQVIYPARSYQANALSDYITNERDGKYLYEYKPDIKFYISKFDKGKLSGNYDNFYSLIRQDGTTSIMSMNELDIRNFVAFINRIISYE